MSKIKCPRCNRKKDSNSKVCYKCRGKLNVNLNNEMWAYLAGFIDGEGTIGIYEHKQKNNNGIYYDPCLIISNTNLEITEFFKKNLGVGHLSNQKSSFEKRGNFYRQKRYYYKVNGRNSVGDILEKIQPYIIIKKEQIKLVLEFCRLPPYTIKTEILKKYYLKAKALNSGSRGIWNKGNEK